MILNMDLNPISPIPFMATFTQEKQLSWDAESICTYMQKWISNDKKKICKQLENS
jgi:hypothetical protein